MSVGPKFLVGTVAGYMSAGYSLELALKGAGVTMDQYEAAKAALPKREKNLRPSLAAGIAYLAEVDNAVGRAVGANLLAHLFKKDPEMVKARVRTARDKALKPLGSGVGG